jgi:hypothetical protein
MTQLIKRNYTYKDHFKCGWGDGTFNFDEDRTGLKYWRSYGRCVRRPMSFREECVNAARLIGETAEKPIMVFFSGGIDSEVVIRSMIEANVPFEVLIINHWYKGQSGLNAHDTQYAIDFVKKHNLKYRIYNFDLSDYLKTKYVSDTKKYLWAAPGRSIICNLIQTFCKDYLCVMGDGEPALVRSRLNGFPDQEGMLLKDDTGEVAALQAAAEYGESVVFGFFHYTPELLLSWFLNEDILNFVKNERAFLHISYISIKPFIYHKQWPDMTPRPKYTGYEMIDREITKWRSNPTDPSIDQELIELFEIHRDFDWKFHSVVSFYDDLLKSLSPVDL